MKNILLIGHKTSANRGNEAILMGTIEAFASVAPGVQFQCLSATADADRKQWSRTMSHNIEFVPYPKLKNHEKVWQKLFKSPKSPCAGIWPFPHSKRIVDLVDSCDAVLSVGGDLYTLDYPPQSRSMSIERLARSRGKPTFLWGSSVGPLHDAPAFRRKVIKHFKGSKGIYVRENLSFEYLQSDLDNVRFCWDPAFFMNPVKPDLSVIDERKSYIGFNISPLTVSSQKGTEAFDHEVSQLADNLKALSEAADAELLLIPHVHSLIAKDGRDVDVLDALGTALRQRDVQVTQVPPEFNAAELKWIISQCTFLIAGRTHATIAAFSTGVPTVSVSYSRKSLGLNDLIFGHRSLVIKKADLACADFVLIYEKAQTKLVNSETLMAKAREAKKSLLSRADEILSSID